ncbi:hypothetical protein SK128_010840 [Halocaridina rubra]|uniref:Uncharacterized protein n=1 Tax=Halocaridina rubra TaxID=373956 RepID=A0AAN8XV72_HALRR
MSLRESSRGRNQIVKDYVTTAQLRCGGWRSQELTSYCGSYKSFSLDPFGDIE